MISFGNAASSHSGLIPLKTVYKKEGNCCGRSRVRRILLTCIQLLLIQLLDIIWFVPKNFAHFQKPLDKFFLEIRQSRDQSSRNIPCKSQEHWKQWRLLNRATNTANFSPRFDFVFTSERPHYSLALFSSFIYTCTFSKKIEFASKRTLG